MLTSVSPGRNFASLTAGMSGWTDVLEKKMVEQCGLYIRLIHTITELPQGDGQRDPHIQTILVSLQHNSLIGL